MRRFCQEAANTSNDLVTDMEGNYPFTAKVDAQHNWLCSWKKPLKGFFLLSFVFIMFAFVTNNEVKAEKPNGSFTMAPGLPNDSASIQRARAIIQNPNAVRKTSEPIVIEAGEDAEAILDEIYFDIRKYIQSKNPTLFTSASKTDTVYHGYHPGGNGPEGLEHIYTYTTTLSCGRKIVVHDTVHTIVPDGKGGFRRAEPSDIPSHFNIMWMEPIAQLLPSPDGSDEYELLLKIPVYQNGDFAGYIVSIEFYEMYPDCIAYLSSSSRTVDTIITIDDSLLESLVSDTSSLRITSQTREKVVMEFDNQDNVDTQFNVYNIINGVLVRQIDSKGSILTIENLPTGVYLVRCATNPSIQNKIIISN